MNHRSRGPKRLGAFVLSVSRVMRWLWVNSPVGVARLLASGLVFLPPSVRGRAWHVLAYDACRGFKMSSSRAVKLLPSLGPYPKDLTQNPPYPQLWWALASTQGQDRQGIYQWASQAGVPLSGRHCGYDFLSASIMAKNRQSFEWGIAQGLPPDGPSEQDEVEETDVWKSCSMSKIESDLRTPLWHAVNLTTIDDPWWVETLLQAGARWDYAGQGKVSAAQLDRQRNLGWSQWWKKRELTKLASRQQHSPKKDQQVLPMM